MAHRINQKCTNCHACLPLCPTQSIYVGLGQYVIDSDTCEDCVVCVQVCPESAIHMIPVPGTTSPEGSKAPGGVHHDEEH